MTLLKAIKNLERHENMSIEDLSDLLSSGLYRRYWNFTNSAHTDVQVSRLLLPVRNFTLPRRLFAYFYNITNKINLSIKFLNII